MNIIQKIEAYFLEDYLLTIDNILGKSKVELSYRICIVLSGLLFLFYPSLRFFGTSLKVLILGLASCSLVAPFIIKYKRDHLLASKVTLIIAFAVIAIIHLAFFTANLLGLGIWYIVIAATASFVIGLRWGLGFIIGSTLNVALIIFLNRIGYNPLDTPPSAFEFISNGTSKDISFILRFSVPFLLIYSIISRYVKSRDAIYEKMNSLIDHQQTLYKELNESKTQHQNLVDGVDDMIYQLDEEGNFTYVNPAVSTVTGYSMKELLANEFKPRSGEVYKDEHLELHKELIKNKETIAYQEFLFYTKSGEKKWVGRKANLFYDEKGVFINSLCIARDITEERAIKTQLIQAKEKAIEATKIKAQFLSSMSHEIRTPMNAVIALTHLMLEEKPREDQKDHLDTLKFSAENLLGLINDILDFSKIEARKIELVKKSFNLKQVVQTLQHGLGSTAKEKGISLQLHLDSELPEVVIGDALRLTQVLNNLVGNAIKFTKVGGVDLTLQQEYSDDDLIRIRFIIEDTGIGIPSDKLTSIFEEFSQVRGEDTKQGTGLGLAITKELLDFQNSKIKVSSEIGKGSVFEFALEFQQSGFLSRSTNDKYRTTNIENYPHGLNGIRLLLVEDNLINQKVTMNFLKKWGLKVDIAFNGQMALDFVKKNEYDLVLMDLQMPVMDGFQATKAIRKLGGKYLKLPIIALTASAVLEVRDEAMEAGLDDFLTKPFLPQKLYSTITEYTPENILLKQKAS